MNLCSVKPINSNYLLELADKAINPLLNSDDFTAIALELFSIHSQQNEVYKLWLSLLKINPKKINKLIDIPFLPIRFFKSHTILLNGFLRSTSKAFASSTTTGGIPSQHFVPFIELYEKSFMNAFKYFYGEPRDWTIVALLPGYLERRDSSLIYMTNSLIQDSSHPSNGFYLNNFDELANMLTSLSVSGQKTLLIGVSFGLLDFIESEAFQSLKEFTFKNLHIMETGGMKGRRTELTRMELHDTLSKAFRTPKIHSEYGMTELLSQAYSDGDGLFSCPPWMKMLIRDTDNPLKITDKQGIKGKHHNGGINFVDLANVFSCPFIAIDDIGQLYPDGRFEVLGRFDQSEIRGCNLMVE